jgi:ubiquinone/menaquinone biosynthesis C-methylase UbiE
MPNPKRNFRKPTKPGRGWDPLATWYDGMVGNSGSDHHQKLAIPKVIELLEVKPRERVVDLGCGQGVLAPHIAKAKAEYTGLDVSKNLIEIARDRHGKEGKFFVDDVANLSERTLTGPKFDAAVFMLSIQDIADLEKAITGAAKLLKEQSRIVILMLHPAFRIPRQSGWGFDEQRKLQFRRVDSYLSKLDVPLKQYAGQSSGVSISHHRPLQDYINALGKAGFAVDKMLEIAGTGVTKIKAKQEERAIAEIPLFMGIRAVKK